MKPGFGPRVPFLSVTGHSPLRGLAFALFAALASVCCPAAPVRFTFSLAPRGNNSFAREIWAEVATPDGRTVRLPAFFDGGRRFAVHARAEAAGDYILERIYETDPDGRTISLDVPRSVRRRFTVRKPETMRAVGRSPSAPNRFVFSDGQPYFPIGANLAWGDRRGLGFYRQALSRFGAAGLNWTRIWMCHWAAQNLDWLPSDMGRSPPPGRLDPRVARFWDRLLELAEDNGVYLQLVLQHHGQYSTVTNPNWADNPWNSANPGGFLSSPEEFFTSEKARRLTKSKYRYIVARWSWSPAILAWELFNEVHWTDALRLRHDVAAVAAWHGEMADYIRSIDVYHHLVTTSTDDLHSPIYARMDYYQPHLYAPDMLLAVRRFEIKPETLDRPVFYGEIGFELPALDDAGRGQGAGLVPPVWSGLLGEGFYAPQPWYGDRLLETDQVETLGALTRFAAQLERAENAITFSPAVESRRRVPLLLRPGQSWRRGPPPEIEVPVDGSQPVTLADVPKILVGGERSLKEGYPDRATFHIRYSQSARIRVRLADAGPRGAHVRVLLDGGLAGEHAWPSLLPPEQMSDDAAPAPPLSPPPPPRPVELSFEVAPGDHMIVLENAGGPDWFALDAIDLGLEIPALAAVGKRARDSIALWVWNREGIAHRENPASRAASAVLQLGHVAPGTWRATWWDTEHGRPLESTTLKHTGGVLELTTPPITRHAAVMLDRIRED